MTTFYAWMVKEPDGSEGPVSVYMPGIGQHTPLVTAKADIARNMRVVAQAHADNSGKPVRLVRFEEAETVETL